MTSALYEKYRPTEFTQVVGKKNKQIAEILQGLVDNPKETNHAVLLSGESGIGKTTLARITCRKILEVDSLKGNICYQEYNMSDKTGIDSVREICESSLTLGISKNRRKCVVLDELHNVSRQGQDALLKFIEGVQLHLYWMLVTDSLEKLDKAIVGRCLNLKLEKPTNSEVAELLSSICKSENKSIDLKTAELIASGTDNIRAAINVLESVINSNKLSYDEVSQLIVSDDEESNLFQDLLIPLVWPFMAKKNGIDPFSHDHILEKLESILEANKAQDVAMAMGGWARKKLLSRSYKVTSKGKEKSSDQKRKEKMCYLLFLNFYCETQWHLLIQPQNKFVLEFLKLVDKIKKVNE